MKFWNFKAKDKDTGELMLYGDISSSTWWGDEVTPKDFKKDLDGLGDIKNLNIYINSGGGDVFAGQAIRSMLKRHTAHKTAYVDGLAASIASVILTAADEIIAPINAMIMWHEAWTVAAGNKGDFRKLADDMEKIDESIVAAYEEQTRLPREEIIALMEAETWFTAKEALEKGIITKIEDEKKLVASIDGSFLMLNNQKFDLTRYKNKPKIEPTIAEMSLEEGIKLVDSMIDYESLNENRDESQPVSDTQKDQFNKLTIKIHDYKEEN